MTLLRLSPMPDEFVAGYQGRLLRHNGWTDVNAAMAALLSCAGHEPVARRATSTVELLARAAGRELGQFVRDHTLIPLARAVIATTPGVPHGSEAQPSLLRTVAMRSLRPGTHFCMACVKEDYEFHGMPYWRREHQLPGRYWCPKHGCPLSHAFAQNAYLRSPTDFITMHQVVSEPWLNQLKQNRPIERFLAICSDLLSSRYPLVERNVARIARARAAEIGLHTGRGAIRKPLVSERIKGQFDRLWLMSVLPGLADWPDGQYCRSVDGVALGKRMNVSAIAYALVFAVLYESADVAIHAMASHPRLDPQCDSACAPSHAADEARLRKAYIATRGRPWTAAAKLHLNPEVTRRRLNALGLPSLRGQSAAAIGAVIGDVLRGEMNLREACIAHGLSQSDMKNVLHAALTPLKQAIDKIKSPTPRPARTPRPKRTLVLPPMQGAEPATAIDGAAADAVARSRNRLQRAARAAA